MAAITGAADLEQQLIAVEMCGARRRHLGPFEPPTPADPIPGQFGKHSRGADVDRGFDLQLGSPSRAGGALAVPPRSEPVTAI
jgi:hypothetical protein